MSDDPLLQQLFDLDRNARLTGRKNYKKISEIQLKMLVAGQEQTMAVQEANRKLIKSCEMLLKQRDELSMSNNRLFFALQETLQPDAIQFHA